MALVLRPGASSMPSGLGLGWACRCCLPEAVGRYYQKSWMVDGKNKAKDEVPMEPWALWLIGKGL